MELLPIGNSSGDHTHDTQEEQFRGHGRAKTEFMDQPKLVAVLITASINAAVSDSWPLAVALAILAAALHYGGKWWLRRRTRGSGEE